MSILTNTTDHVVAYRDDSGKHYAEPGEQVEIVGDQHVPSLRSVFHGTGGVAREAPAEDSGAPPDEAGSRPRRRR